MSGSKTGFMSRPALSLAITVALVAGQASFGLVNPADVQFDSKGQLRVVGWLQMKEIDYGNGIDYTANTVTGSGTNWVEYENVNLSFRKEYVLVDDVLTITQYITPKNETGRASKLETRLDFAAESRSFAKWYQPWVGACEDASGQVFDANPGGSDWACGQGAVSYATCGVYIGPGGSLMTDRLLAGGYISYGSGPARVAADISEVDWPLYTFATAEFSPAQTDIDASWRDNRFSYNTSVNTIVYRFRFLNTSDPIEAITQASQAYFGDRKAEGQTFYQGWSSVSSPPSEPIASFSMVAANWGGGTSGVTGAVGQNCKGSLIQYRRLLDNRGLTSYNLYFWVMLYEPDTRGGWGDLPTPEKPAPGSDVNYLIALRDFLADLKASVANLKVGLYVNAWAAWEGSKVYTDHPSWFRSRSMTNDGGGTAYFGKLPQWGQHLYDPNVTPDLASVGEMIQSYDLDFVFFDNGGFVDALSGDVTAMRAFFTNLVQAVHDAGAIAISNGINPYMDMFYLERVAGKTPNQDDFFVNSFEQISYDHPRMIAPLLQRIGDDYLFAVPAFFNNGWTNEVGFVPYFPAHFSDELVQGPDGYQRWANIIRSRHYPADLNGDYYVNWADFGIFASQWLQCSDPQDPDCF